MLHVFLEGVLSDSFLRDDVRSFLVFFENLDKDSPLPEVSSSQDTSPHRRQYIPAEIQKLLKTVPTELNQSEVVMHRPFPLAVLFRQVEAPQCRFVLSHLAFPLFSLYGVHVILPRPACQSGDDEQSHLRGQRGLRAAPSLGTVSCALLRDHRNLRAARIGG